MLRVESRPSQVQKLSWVQESLVRQKHFSFLVRVRVKIIKIQYYDKSFISEPRNWENMRKDASRHNFYFFFTLKICKRSAFFMPESRRTQKKAEVVLLTPATFVNSRKIPGRYYVVINTKRDCLYRVSGIVNGKMSWKIGNFHKKREGNKIKNTKKLPRFTVMVGKSDNSVYLGRTGESRDTT